MKILFIIETLGRGGAERVLVNTLPELKKLGLKCEVAILFDRDDLAEELEKKGVIVHRLNLSYKWNIPEGVYKLYTLSRRGNYDIIHAHLFFAYFYTGLVKLCQPKIKTVTTFHNLAFNAYPANSLVKKIRKWLDCKIVTNLFDKTTAVSTAVKTHYKKYFYLDNIDIIFNSFPIEQFKEYKQNKSDNILEEYVDKKDSDFVVLTAGRYVETKGHKYLIDAIKILNQKYSNLIFLFIGKGPLESFLNEQAPSNLKIISEINHSELMKIYKQVDLIVVPSVYEAFGLVVGEAMIMEKPIVATEVDGIVEMVTHEKEGLLVPPKDSKALALAIERVYSDKVLRAYLTKHAKEKIKSFDTKIIARQWKEYYEGMIN